MKELKKFIITLEAKTQFGLPKVFMHRRYFKDNLDKDVLYLMIWIDNENKIIINS